MIQPLIKALFGDSDAAADADTVKGILLYEVVCAGSADTQDVLDFINRIGSFIKLACGCSQSFFCTLIHSSDSCVSKEQYIEAESRALANRFFDGAMSRMVVSFLNQKELSSEDLDELQRILDKKRKK